MQALLQIVFPFRNLKQILTFAIYLVHPGTQAWSLQKAPVPFPETFYLKKIQS